VQSGPEAKDETPDAKNEKGNQEDFPPIDRNQENLVQKANNFSRQFQGYRLIWTALKPITKEDTKDA